VHLDKLTGRRVALLGMGADLTAAVPAIVAAGPAEIRVAGDQLPDELPEGLPRDPVTPLADACAWAEVIVRSPGFSPYRPEVAAAVRRGAMVTNPVDLWMGTHAASRTVVGVTGTKGKSTVTHLVGALAPAHGLRVGVAGNLGPPVLGETWDHQAPNVILEVSSYQAADLHHVPNLVVVTHLAEDHLPWHGGRERYHADKLRLVTNEGGTAGEVLVPDSSPAARDGVEALGVAPTVVAVPAGPPELPAHRVANAALAVEVLNRLGGPAPTVDAVIAAARTSLPGRLDPCPGPTGLLCVDDALASNPTATAAALAWLRGIGRATVVLLGGEDRGADVAPLVDEITRWPVGKLRAVALPDSGEELAIRCGADLVAVASSVAEATALAVEAAGPAGAVLLSPGAPTPSRVGNWSTRSNQFREALTCRTRH